MGFPRQAYLSGLSFPPPGDLPYPGIEPVSLTSPALAGRFFTTSTTWEEELETDIFFKKLTLTDILLKNILINFIELKFTYS